MTFICIYIKTGVRVWYLIISYVKFDNSKWLLVLSCTNEGHESHGWCLHWFENSRGGGCFETFVLSCKLIISMAFHREWNGNYWHYNWWFAWYITLSLIMMILFQKTWNIFSCSVISQKLIWYRKSFFIEDKESFMLCSQYHGCPISWALIHYKYVILPV